MYDIEPRVIPGPGPAPDGSKHGDYDDGRAIIERVARRSGGREEENDSAELVRVLDFRMGSLSV